MRNFTIFQVDAFTNNQFSGNPAAVVPLQEWLSDKLMQSIAAENNLAETAFFVPEGDTYHLRWFTPEIEVDLCGHATLASAHVLFNHLGYERSEIQFSSRSGLLTVSQQDGLITLNFPANPATLMDEISGTLVKSLGVEPNEAHDGMMDLVVFKTEEEVADLQPDFYVMSRLEAFGVIATAPGNTVDFVSRVFVPKAGIPEDPVTGAAHTVLTPYWANKLGKSRLSAKQISQRGGDLVCELKADRVLISGKAVTYLKGEISVLADVETPAENMVG